MVMGASFPLRKWVSLLCLGRSGLRPQRTCVSDLLDRSRPPQLGRRTDRLAAGATNDGAVFDPTAATWSPITCVGAPPPTLPYGGDAPLATSTGLIVFHAQEAPTRARCWTSNPASVRIPTRPRIVYLRPVIGRQLGGVTVLLVVVASGCFPAVQNRVSESAIVTKRVVAMPPQILIYTLDAGGVALQRGRRGK